MAEHHLSANAGRGPAALGANTSQNAREYLQGLEDKSLMDEYVALYIGMSGHKESKELERKFRESLDVSNTLKLN